MDTSDKLLDEIELFIGVDHEKKQEIAQNLSPVDFVDDVEIIGEGEQSPSFYIIKEGKGKHNLVFFL